ncbi:response regulator [Belliella sp. R4-6]|uniref:histidine kinase n=1 Tax=Belliella alkalica TaxID=1730871 RepID=A0ABS9V7C5_9BACT|nr:hybrid sensor histidine kinase/response regulator [Belliella alkalica]MCH7412273.1 response regulator [Belliella alkalica]
MKLKLPNAFLILILFLSSFSLKTQAQKVFDDDNFLKPVSVFEFSEITNVGDEAYSIEDIIKSSPKLDFEKIEGKNTNLGFTKDNYWLKFSIKNSSNSNLSLFFETGRPITDIVELYQLAENNQISFQRSGDLVPFIERPLNHRKIIFPIDLPANSTQQFYIQYQSDGEVINLPLNFHSSNSLILQSYLDQFIFGIFYGILFLAGAIYLFFYFGIKEKSFLLYSAYVLSIALLHFSLDGYFIQYIAPNAGWISRNSILLAAALSTLAFGRYTQVYMNVKSFNLSIHKAYNVLHLITFLLIFAVIAFDEIKHLYYPIVNILGIILLILIVIALSNSYIKKSAPDVFFSLGILAFFIGFVFFILNNFSLVPNSFFTENSSKLGTGFEMIFLSLSMANRIRKLKSEKEEMQSTALVRSQESNDIKSFFLSNISHELRTPLNAVIGLSKSIQAYTNDEKITNDLEVIQYSSLGLLSAIDDILDYSKIEKRELKLEEKQFELPKLIQELRVSTENQAKGKNLNFIYEEINQVPKLVLGDKNRLRQILANLLNNAVKFTNLGEVKLSIKSEILNNKKFMLSINVSDTGVGINTNKLDRIFESFIQEQIDDKRKFGGFGLGLCIVKALVELNKGQIEISSRPGLGTEVQVKIEVKLPQINSYEIDKLTHQSGTYDLGGKIILIVEDNPVNQLVMKSILKKWANTKFIIANHGLEAVEILNKEKIDLILMDLQMPEMDGYEATTAIRNGVCGEDNKNIPIIAVTADATEKAKNRVIEVGMDDYLTKPIDSEDLYSKIKKCFYLQNVDLSDVI